MNDRMPTITECHIERTILRTLYYFELFSYPLTEQEILRFAHNLKGDAESIPSEAALQEKLRSLEEEGKLFRFGEYFQTRNTPEWVGQRQDNNSRADAMLPIARRIAGLIDAFPFVRAVFVSGSLSKHSMRPDSDIDFFIITEPERLWLARTLLVAFKKLFLFNSHKYFCVNYFIDTEHLEIEEKNLFTATEVVTLLPMYGKEWCQAFFSANTWAFHQFPQMPRRSMKDVPPQKQGMLKRTLEYLLSGRFGNWLDQLTLRITVGFWKRKFRHFDDPTFNIALKSRRYVSKHHPMYFQDKVLRHMESKV